MQLILLKNHVLTLGYHKAQIQYVSLGTENQETLAKRILEVGGVIHPRTHL